MSQASRPAPAQPGPAQLSSRYLLGAGLALTLALAVLDYALTQQQIALPFYYLVPILLLAWFGGWRLAAIETLAAALVNLLIDLALSRSIVQPLRVHLASAIFFLLALGAARGVATLKLMLDYYRRGDAWKTAVRPHRLGERVVVVPAWQRDAYAADPQARPNDLVLLMDPGRAFGTGSHPTTQMCVALLEQHVRPGDRVFDLGCGTGILSVAAAKLGAGSVLGVDIAPEAVAAAQQNAALNGVAAQASFRQGTLRTVLDAQPTTASTPSEALPFRLTLANILTPIIIDALQHGLARTVSADGLAILSGIRAEQAASVVAAMQAAGLALVDRRESEDWVALVGQPREENP